jgi:hypothetical protein
MASKVLGTPVTRSAAPTGLAGFGHLVGSSCPPSSDAIAMGIETFYVSIGW